MFEHFREEHVPECDVVQSQQDIFNTGEEADSNEELF
jgi:hypothetical protein